MIAATVADTAGAPLPTRGRTTQLWSFLSNHEPWLLLPAGVPLLLGEWVRDWFGSLAGGSGTFVPELAAMVWLGVLWLARLRHNGRWSCRTALDGPIFALVLMLPLGWAVARDPVAAVGRAESLLFAIAVYYAMANAVSTPRRAWLATAWLLVGGLAIAAIALVSVDWTAKVPALTPILGRLPRLIAEVPHPTLAHAGVHPNTVGGLLSMVVALSAALTMWPAGERAAGTTAAPGWLRVLAVLTLAICGFVLLLSQSRGAWLAFGVCLWFVLTRRRNWPWWLALGVVVSVALALGSMLALDLAQIRHWPGVQPLVAILASRRALWSDALAMLARQPATGIGLNNFPLVHGLRPEYGGGFVYQGFPHAHNVWLQAGLDYGVPGLVAVVGLVSGCVWLYWRLQRRFTGSPMAPLAAGLGLALLAYAVHGSLDAIAIGAKPGFFIWAVAGVLAGVRHRAHRWIPLPVPALARSGEPLR